jgi:hypothetical protein
MRPDATHELSDGVVIQTQLLGRLLGMRVLRVDGIVQVSPATVSSGRADLTDGAVMYTTPPPAALARGRSTLSSPTHASVGAGLAAAGDLIRQTRAMLDADQDDS